MMRGRLRAGPGKNQFKASGNARSTIEHNNEIFSERGPDASTR
jgi:hypothetical protein